jgi:4'-phosphopantetheinyl transferase
MASFSIGLSLLSSNTQKGRYNKNLSSAESRRLLSLLAGRSLNGNDIKLEENGRPYFADGGEDFNISHSGELTAVSLVSGDKLRTGCDVELVKPRAGIIRVAEEFFSAQERDYVLDSSQKQNNHTAFFEVWTLKECYLKLRGLSVADMKKTPSFICKKDGNFFFAFNAETETPLSFYLYELKGASGELYILAAAIEGVIEGTGQLLPELRWFSQSTLRARSIAEINAARSPAETVSPKS